jgi:methylthioribulose-1-phosphate dehydratase
MESLVAQQLADVGRQFASAGWMRGTAGNLSARLSKSDRYLITASGRQKGELTHRDFVALSHGMRAPEPRYRKWSAETVVHDELYRSDGSIGSVLHVHGPFSTLLSRTTTGAGASSLDVSGFEYVKGLGFWGEDAEVQIPVVPNHHDIPQLANAILNARTEVPAVLVRSHGIYAWGASIDDARRHLECTEFLCEMVWRERRGAQPGH